MDNTDRSHAEEKRSTCDESEEEEEEGREAGPHLVDVSRSPRECISSHKMAGKNSLGLPYLERASSFSDMIDHDCVHVPNHVR